MNLKTWEIDTTKEVYYFTGDEEGLNQYLAEINEQGIFINLVREIKQ